MHVREPLIGCPGFSPSPDQLIGAWIQWEPLDAFKGYPADVLCVREREGVRVFV